MELPPERELVPEPEPLPIEKALYEAVQRGEMSIKECQDCIEAYEDMLHRTHDA